MAKSSVLSLSCYHTTWTPFWRPGSALISAFSSTDRCCTNLCRGFSTDSSNNENNVGKFVKLPRVSPKYGAYIGNPNDEIRGMKAARASESEKTRRDRLNLKYRRSYPDHELRPFVNYTAIVFANGATTYAPYQHPAGFPAVFLTDRKKNPENAPSKGAKEKNGEDQEKSEKENNDGFMKQLFSKKS